MSASLKIDFFVKFHKVSKLLYLAIIISKFHHYAVFNYPATGNLKGK